MPNFPGAHLLTESALTGLDLRPMQTPYEPRDIIIAKRMCAGCYFAPCDPLFAWAGRARLR